MNRVTLIILGVAVAIVVAFFVGGPLPTIHRRAEAAARLKLYTSLSLASSQAVICEYDSKSGNPDEKESCAKADRAAAELPAIVDAYRRACRSCASRERCEDEIAVIQKLTTGVIGRSACDD